MGKSKLSQSITLASKSNKMRFQLSRSCKFTEDCEKVFVDQTVNRPASVRTRLPDFNQDRLDCFPSTGWSRFAIQNVVQFQFPSQEGLLNHTA